MQHLLYEVSSGRMRCAVASDIGKNIHDPTILPDSVKNSVITTLDGLIFNEFDKMKPKYSTILKGTGFIVPDDTGIGSESRKRTSGRKRKPSPSPSPPPAPPQSPSPPPPPPAGRVRPGKQQQQKQKQQKQVRM
jgi:hypothetical protein